MSVDRYTKAVLTVIAIALIGINIALWEGRAVKPAYAAEQVYVMNWPITSAPVIPLEVHVTNMPPTPVIPLRVRVTNPFLNVRVTNY